MGIDAFYIAKNGAGRNNVIRIYMLEVRVVVNSTLEKVWEAWIDPAQIMHWNFAADTWHCPAAHADFRVGGSYAATMAAKDGSFSFEFGGVYLAIDPMKKLSVDLGADRFLEVYFEETEEGVCVTERFTPEEENPYEAQQAGW